MEDLPAIATLGEPTRRALYLHVAASRDWVSRDAAAAALGLERATAAHHLDRLAADGLLEVEYRRLSGRSGPGAGRPAKLYRRARQELGVTLPQRDYELVGRLLADAADRARVEGRDIAVAIDEAAAAEGRRLAEEISARLAAAPSRGRAERREAVLTVLAERGFEPHVDDEGTVVLRNCPFHRLAREHTELICGMNHCLLRAALDGVGSTGLDARLEPEEDHCCVRLHPSG